MHSKEWMNQTRILKENKKKCSVNPQEGRRKEVENKQKMKNEMADLSLT